jgi:hypothetical protein
MTEEGIQCDACGTISNPDIEPIFLLDDGTRLCEECEQERCRGDYDDDIDNIMRVDPYYNVKESLV